MKQPQLAASLAGEILNPTLDLAQDYAEMSIDALMTNEVIKEIPLVKTAVAVFKTGMAIREWHFVKKLLAFLKAVQAGSADNEATREYRERINSDSAFHEKVAEHLLVILERYVTIEKAQILAQLFKAHVNGDIKWEDFMSLSVVLDALQHSSYKFLEQTAAAATPFFYHGGDSPEEAPLSPRGSLPDTALSSLLPRWAECSSHTESNRSLIAVLRVSNRLSGR